MKLKHYLQGFTTFALLLMLLSSSVFAQTIDLGGFGEEDSSHVDWIIDFVQKEVKPGSYVQVKGTATIDKHWHMYSVLKQDGKPLEIDMIELGGLEMASKLYSPIGKKVVDPEFGMITYELNIKTEIGFWLKVPENINKNETTIKFLLLWQICGEMCVEGDKEVELTLKISDNGEFIDKMTFPKDIAFQGDKYKEKNTETTPVKPDEKVDERKNTDNNKPETTNAEEKHADTPKNEKEASEKESDDLLWFLLMAAIGGFLSILTPCVFPMIPITISYFVKLSEQKNTKPVVLSITYIIGIVFTLTFFGLVLALILGSIDIGNQIAGLPWVNLIIAVILIIFTLSFFGLFELTLPSGIINRLNKIGRNPNTGAVISTFVLGVVFTMTSFACTGPIMGSIVTTAVTSGEYFRAFTGMLVYSIFFAMPFFFLALSPGLIKKLPKSGIWMVKMKVFMGFIIFLFAWIFVVNFDRSWGLNIFTRPVVVAIWAATFFLMGFYALGKFHFKEEGSVENSGVSALGGFFAIFLFALGIYFGGSSITGRPVWGYVNTFFPIEETTPALSERAEAKKLTWIYDYEKGIQQAKDEGKSVLLYSTQHVCKNCKLNEINVFPKAEIINKLKNFTLVKLYNDKGDHATSEEAKKNKEITSKYEILGVYPTYLIVNPETEKTIHGKASIIQGKLSVSEFAEFLDKHIKK